MLLACYLIYSLLCLLVVAWLGRTLFRTGRPFLVHCLHGDGQRADALNHLLLAGFYLLNAGWLAGSLVFAEQPHTVLQGIRIVSQRFGVVCLLLGGLHFLNVLVLLRFRLRLPN